jgi:hypothetical protein
MASFLQKLFKPKWEHQDSAIRLEAVSSELSQEILLGLANHDPEVQVRIKAINLLSSLSDIKPLISDKAALVKTTATDRYISIATDAQEEKLQIQNLSSIVTNNQNSTEILLTIAVETKNQTLAQAALDLIHDEASLFDFIMSSQSAKARLKAAEKITISSMLKKLESHFKGKDKTLHRFAKDAIQKQLAAQTKIDSAKQATASLLEQSKQLSSSAFNPTYEAQVAHIKQSWKKAEYTEAHDQEFQSAIDECEAILGKNKEQQAAINTENANKAEALKQHNIVFDSIKALFKTYKEKGAPSLTSIRTSIDDLNAKWLQADEIYSASKTEQSDFKTAMTTLGNMANCLESLEKAKAFQEKGAHNIESKKSLKKSIQSLLQSMDWPAEFQKPNEIAQLITLNEQLNNDIDSLKSSEHSHIETTQKKLSHLEQEIEKGNLKQASRIYNEIKKALALIEHNQAKPLQSQFQMLSSELNNLKDWKEFAAEPKFIELCASMESLIQSTLLPIEIADQIKDLQNQWKALGSLGDKKQQDTLWTRFKTASDQAYLPCKAYYENLSNTRQFNFEQRVVICEQLEALFQQQNWDSANWKALQKIVDKAFHEYKKFAPVDRSQNASIQKRFNDATQSIKKQLHNYYQSNLETKQSLINECSELLTSDDLISAIERCKAIQEQWKTIESAGKSEQVLWVKFREQCDAIFDRRQQEYQAKRTHTDTLIKDAQGIVESAKQLESSSNRESLSQLEQFKQDIRALDIPDKISSAKIHVISEIEKTIKGNISHSYIAAEQQQWINARTLSEKVSSWELNSDTPTDELKDTIKNTELPKSVSDILINRIDSPNKEDFKTLQDHCLSFEIALGIESPASEQQNRMALQIKRLQENMGKQPVPRQETLLSAQLDWFGFTAQSEDFLELQTRFFNGLKQTSAA